MADDSINDEWISFEDFCQGVDSFLAPNSKSPGAVIGDDGETIATLPQGTVFATLGCIFYLKIKGNSQSTYARWQDKRVGATSNVNKGSGVDNFASIRQR